MDNEVIDQEIKNSNYKYTFKLSTAIIWISLILIAVFFILRLWTGGTTLFLFSSAGFSAYSFSGMFALKGKHLKYNNVYH